jgi:hypothetical protein
MTATPAPRPYPRTAAPRSSVVHGLSATDARRTVCGRTVGDTWAGEHDAAPVGPITCAACLRHLTPTDAAPVSPAPTPRPTPACYVPGWSSAYGTAAPADDPGQVLARWSAMRHGATTHLVLDVDRRTVCGAAMEGGYAHLTGEWSVDGGADACPTCAARAVGAIVARDRSGLLTTWVVIAPYGYAPAARVRPGQEVRVGIVRPTWVTVSAVSHDDDGVTILNVTEDPTSLAMRCTYAVPTGDWLPVAGR